MSNRDARETRADAEPDNSRPLQMTGGALDAIRANLLSEGLLCRLDDEGIARRVAIAFLGDETRTKSLAELRDAVAAIDGCPDDVPEEPSAFAKWVRVELLWLQHHPRTKLAELYEWASRDLATIQENIRQCEAKLEEVKRRSQKSGAEKYDTAFYSHFRRMNEEARDEIVDVLANRIEREAVRAASVRLFHGALDLHVPWAFRWRPSRYSAEDYSEIAHAFLKLPLRRFHRVQELHREGHWNEFDQALRDYIESQRVADSVREMVGEHHLLAARKDVLVPALGAYDRAEYALFTSAAAVQVEGIFGDACALSEISVEELRAATLVPKVEALHRLNDTLIDYPYYAFRFPVLRNHVAHGHLPPGDFERTARLLLLDLQDVCRVVIKHPSASNALVRFLRQPRENQRIVADAVEFALLIAETDLRQPHQFYGLSRAYDEWRVLLSDAALWSFLEGLASSKDEDVASGLRIVATRLRRELPEAKSLLMQIADRGRDPLVRDGFLNAVRLQSGHDKALGMML